MEETSDISTWRTNLAYLAKLFAKCMIALLVLALPPLAFNFYQDIHGVPINSEVYATYSALYEGFTGFLVVTIGLMGAGFWLHYKLTGEMRKEFFWLAVVVSTALTARFLL